VSVNTYRRSIGILILLLLFPFPANEVEAHLLSARFGVADGKFVCDPLYTSEFHPSTTGTICRHWRDCGVPTFSNHPKVTTVVRHLDSSYLDRETYKSRLVSQQATKRSISVGRFQLPWTHLTNSSNDSAYHPRTSLTFSISLNPSGSSCRSLTRWDNRIASSSRKKAAGGGCDEYEQ
jgi:hypothetical protein